MKNSIPFCLLILLTFNFLHAQPTLTFDNYYQLNVPITQHYLDATLGSIGESGENVTWDMSRLEYNPLELTVELKAAEDTPYFNYFPEETQYNEANFCLAVYDGVLNTDYHYLLKTDKHIEFMGNKSTDGVVELDFYSFQDRQKIFYNELQYNQIEADEFEASVFDFSGSEWHYDKGVDSTHYDAYGTLITPDGETLEDIFRIKETIYHRDSSDLGVFLTKEEKYFWYQKDIAYPIIDIQIRTFNGNVNPNPIAYYNPPPIANNLQDLTQSSFFNLELSPVPSNDVLDIKFEAKTGGEQAQLKVYDVNGRLLKERMLRWKQGENALQLEVSDLVSGFYMISLETSEEYVRGRFLKN